MKGTICYNPNSILHPCIKFFLGPVYLLNFFCFESFFKPLGRSILYTTHSVRLSENVTHTNVQSTNEILSKASGKHSTSPHDAVPKTASIYFPISISVFTQSIYTIGKLRLKRDYVTNTASHFNKCLIEFCIVML